jgi:hypothetical protein
MIILFDFTDFLSVQSLSGHYQDHSVVGRSAVGDSVARA